MHKIFRLTAATLALTAALACGTASAQTPVATPDAGSSAAFNSVMCALLGISSEHNIFCTGVIIG
ncbi:hypothetical protein ATM97_19470 [Nocardia sp. MH4]|uniref:hypothetical protein n=1 Tax=Nocardia TaxID=1817 RepID=UPI001C5011E5|nr:MULTISPECIES: hypothetical protein [Nocardia]MBW0272365.1 hypothetical protein [Nocardia sp. MH4]